MNPVPVLPSRLYDVLKYLALVVFPAIGTLYYGIANLWGLPNANEVVGTIVIVDAFLGAVLNLSNKAYNASDAKYDGDVVVDSEGKASLAFNDHPDEMAKTKDELVLKVRKTDLKPKTVKRAPRKVKAGPP